MDTPTYVYTFKWVDEDPEASTTNLQRLSGERMGFIREPTPASILQVQSETGVRQQDPASHLERIRQALRRRSDRRKQLYTYTSGYSYQIFILSQPSNGIISKYTLI
jgi:hypothetical protein